MNKAVTGGLMALWLAAVPAMAATIDVGSHVLLENTAGQTIQIYVEPGDPVEEISGMDLFAQIADGGPEMGMSTDGPEFSGADLVAGTIFEEDAVPVPPQVLPGGQIVVGGVLLGTPGSNVDADGMIVTLTVDTTGFFVGDPRDPWELRLTETLDTPTAFGKTQMVDPGPPPVYRVVSVTATIINGTISLRPIPEPSTLVMLLALMAGVSCLLVRRSRRRYS